MGIRERIDELKKRNKIESDAKLLQLIYLRIGKDTDDARNEAGNFSKMLKGDGSRKLPIEYAAALEDIFGVTLDFLLNGNRAKKEFENRGLEFTAYQDSKDLYEKLYNQTDADGNRIFGNYDEFENSIIDYIVKYHSLNGVRFLFENELCMFETFQNRFRFTGDFYFDASEEIHKQFINMIFEIDDSIIFDNAFKMENLYDEYNDKSIVFSDEFIKKCLDSTNIYSRLINYEKIDLQLFNGNLSNTSYKTRDMFTCHPLLNYMIKYAVIHENEYASKLDDLLNHASNNNYHIVNHIKNEIGLHTLQSLKVSKEGMVIDYLCKLGIIATFDYPISPDLSDNTKRRLNELKAFSNEITFHDSYNRDGSLKTHWLREGDYILRKASNNPVEYEMLEQMHLIGFDGVPTLIETKNSVDKFEYIEGEVKSFSNLPENWESSVARYFQRFHKICMNKLNGKVYCHDSLKTKDVVFDSNGEIKALVDWSKCYIGNIEDDLIDIVLNWININRIFFKNERENTLDQIKYFLMEYVGDSKVKIQFGDKLKDYLESAIRILKKSDPRYDDRFCSYKNSLTFTELYIEELNKF